MKIPADKLRQVVRDFAEVLYERGAICQTDDDRLICWTSSGDSVVCNDVQYTE